MPIRIIRPLTNNAPFSASHEYHVTLNRGGGGGDAMTSSPSTNQQRGWMSDSDWLTTRAIYHPLRYRVGDYRASPSWIEITTCQLPVASRNYLLTLFDTRRMNRRRKDDDVRPPSITINQQAVANYPLPPTGFKHIYGGFWVRLSRRGPRGGFSM